MINLVDISNVVHFDEGNHIYTRLSDGKTLCGVTSMMKLMGVSPDYSGVSDEVLRIAAERGRKIHLSCNMADVFDNFVDCREADAYLRMRRDKGLIPIESEYLVSDNEDIASCIDIVFTTEELQKENKVILADIKCTSSIHEKPLSWQLSVYKKMFEEQNPDIKVAGLIGIWLPKEKYGNPKIFDVEEIDSKQVNGLISLFKSGTFISFPAETSDNVALLAVQDKLIQVLTTIDKCKKMETELKQRLLDAMKEANVKKWESDKIVVSRVVGGTSQIFDATKFKAENGDLYNQYLKTTEKKDSLRIKIK